VIKIREKISSYCVFIGLRNTAKDLNGGNQDYGFKTESTKLKVYAGSTTPRMVVDGYFGYVGIGTESPGYPLMVAGAASTGYGFATVHLSSDSTETGILFTNFASGGKNYALYSSGGTSGLGQGKFAICDVDNGAARLVIDSVGNVGIGMIPASGTTCKLTVNGKIGCREIIVTTGSWPDYVFKKDYKLKPLPEVEKNIQQSGHLEGIPSKAEATKNGIAVGEMQSKLLQKVEELTLYMIDLKKENQELKERLSRVEKKTNTQLR
jgi:hypothetical protein